MNHPPPPSIRQFIEDTGLCYESGGLPRMAGRMAGWLLVCDPPHQSASDLAAALGASASSVSGAARILVDKGLVERVGVPGHRKAHFRIRQDAWTPTMNGWLARARCVRELAEEGIRALEGEGLAGVGRLTELRDFHRFLERELPELSARWKRERSK